MFTTAQMNQASRIYENREAFMREQAESRRAMAEAQARAAARREALIIVGVAVAAIGGFILFLAVMAIVTGRTS